MKPNKIGICSICSREVYIYPIIKKCERCCKSETYQKHKYKYKEKKHIYYIKNRERLTRLGREKRKEQKRDIKNEIFKFLGGKCECCGETKIEFLCIDHKNGGGRKERKGKSQITYLRGILKQIKQTTKFRILCWNCNSSFGLYNRCPHQDGKVLGTIERIHYTSYS